MPTWLPALIAVIVTLIGAFIALKVLVTEIKAQMVFMQTVLVELKNEIHHLGEWRVEVTREIASHEVRLKVIEKVKI